MITALVLAAATGLLPLAAVPAAAAPAAAPAAAAVMASGPCSGATGVTVVVDFGSYGGTVVRCAAGDPTSASDALRAARFSQVRVQRDPAFLCRIDEVPGEKQDACVVTPPAGAYWALWTVNRDGAWTFANLGVDALDPKPGSVIGFAFGASAKPGIEAPVPAQSSSAKPRATAPAASSSPASAAAASSSPPSSHAVTASASPTGSAGPPASSTAPAPSSSPSALSSSAAPAASLAATPTAGRADEPAGGSVGAWVGVGAVIAIGTAAWARTRLRRRR